MEVNFFKTVIRLLVFILCLLFPSGMISATNDIPLKGQFEKEGARSITPQQPVLAYLDGSRILVGFYQWLPEVTVTIKDSHGNVVYSRVLITPKSEVLLLENLNPGTYYLELRTTSGYMHGIFVVTGS